MKVDMQRLAAEAHLKAMQQQPPPIPFEVPSKSKKGKSNNDKSDDDDDTKYVTVNVKLDAKDKASETLKRKLKVFDDGTPEEYCKWRKDYDDLTDTYASSYGKPETRLSLLRTILKGKSWDVFSASHIEFKELNEAQKKDDRISPKAVIEMGLNDLAQDVFKDPKATRRQIHYMRNGLFFDGKMSIRDWGKRLLELNKYFPYFPSVAKAKGGHESPKEFKPDELNDILDMQNQSRGS
jgi:hypothetical protein